MNKLTEKDALAIRQWAGEGFSNDTVAALHGISEGHVRRILRGDVWDTTTPATYREFTLTDLILRNTPEHRAILLNASPDANVNVWLDV